MTRQLVDPERRLLDYARAAAYLSISLRAFKELAANGEVVKTKIGGRVLFDKIDLDDLIDRKKQAS